MCDGNFVRSQFLSRGLQTQTVERGGHRLELLGRVGVLGPRYGGLASVLPTTLCFKEAGSFNRVPASLLCSLCKVRRGLPSLKALERYFRIKGTPLSHSGFGGARLGAPRPECGNLAFAVWAWGPGKQAPLAWRMPGLWEASFAARGLVAAQGWFVCFWCTWQLLSCEGFWHI